MIRPSDENPVKKATDHAEMEPRAARASELLRAGDGDAQPAGNLLRIHGVVDPRRARPREV